VLKEAKKIGVRYLEISGGEPLLYFNKVIKIIKLAKKLGFKTMLNTNGYFLIYSDSDKAIKKLSGLDQIILSVDDDHLKFITYEKILCLIKKVLDTKIELIINVTFHKQNTKENLLLLKRLSGDLNGKLLKLSLFKRFDLEDRYYYLELSHFLILSKKIIPIGVFNVVKTDVNKDKVQVLPMQLKKIIFMPCRILNPLIDYNSNIYMCCSMHALNHPRLYSTGKVGEKKDIFNISSPMLREMMYGIFPFLTFFLKIKKNKTLFRKFLKGKYYIPCDFCLEIFKHKKEIENIPSPPIYEKIAFTISNFSYFLNSIRLIILFKLTIWIRNFTIWMLRIPITQKLFFYLYNP
jgi:hypothetical protein